MFLDVQCLCSRRFQVQIPEYHNSNPHSSSAELASAAVCPDCFRDVTIEIKFSRAYRREISERLKAAPPVHTVDVS